MTFKELFTRVFKGELYEYEKIFNKHDKYLKTLLGMWNEKPRITEKDVRDFYVRNELYSYQLIHKLPLDEDIKTTNSTGSTISRQVADLFRYTYQTVLDYGCGTGCDGMMYDHFGYQVTLTDIPAPHTQIATLIAKKRGMNFINIDDITGKYDIINCLQVLEHTLNPIQILYRFYEMCTGLLILDVWFDNNHGRVPYHLNTQYNDTWQEIVVDLGFKPLIMKENGVPIVYQKNTLL